MGWGKEVHRKKNVKGKKSARKKNCPEKNVRENWVAMQIAEFLSLNSLNHKTIRNVFVK